MTRFLTLPLCLLALPLAADEDRFVASNMQATLYHELAHALVDILGLPIFGQEEDAADTLSALIIADYVDEDAAVAMAYDTALGFSGEAIRLEEYGEDIYLSGVHGPDMQRYFNFVCIFYGADPDERDDIADELGLPEDRQDSCPDEYDMVVGSWGAVLDELAASDANGKLILQGDDATLTAALADDIDWLNGLFSFPQDIPVLLDACDEPNAFYDMGTQEITMCTEYPDDVRELYAIVDG